LYIPKHFEESRTEVLWDLIRASPLASLVTLSSVGLVADPIPLSLAEDESPAATLGTLRGHVARANPLWREYRKETECLAIFQGPQTYISPSWYATKEETGKVVPTWNYVIVQAHGPLQIRDDAEWLLSHLEALTDQNESAFPEPWSVSDAPRPFIEKLREAIVGIEIPIRRLSGKWKISQNQPLRNQEGVAQGLREMARLVEEHLSPAAD
jgi:transcriptional regulator